MAGALVGVIATLAVVLLMPGDDAPSQGTVSQRSFYIEARIDARGDSAQPYEHGPKTVSYKWWYEPGKFRWEIGMRDALLGDGAKIVAFDGRNMATYDWASNIYRSEVQPMSLPGPLGPSSASLHVGPLSYVSLDDFLASDRGSPYTGRGEEEVLGRRTEVYVQVLASRPPSGLPPGMGQGRSFTEQRRITLWIEREPLAVLKASIEYADGSVMTIETTKLEYGVEIDDGMFTQRAPSGSLDTSATPRPSSSSSRSDVTPAPFMSPAYVPLGLTNRGSGSSQHSYYLRFTPRQAETPYLELQQTYRHGGLPAGLTIHGTPTASNAGTLVVRREGDTMVYILVRGDILISAKTDAIEQAEVVRVLESLR